MSKGFARHINDPRITRITLGYLDDDSPVERFDCPQCQAPKYVDVRRTWWECNNCLAVYFPEFSDMGLMYLPEAEPGAYP